jgi:hypothetical protein
MRRWCPANRDYRSHARRHQFSKRASSAGSFHDWVGQIHPADLDPEQLMPSSIDEQRFRRPLSILRGRLWDHGGGGILETIARRERKLKSRNGIKV